MLRAVALSFTLFQKRSSDISLQSNMVVSLVIRATCCPSATDRDLAAGYDSGCLCTSKLIHQACCHTNSQTCSFVITSLGSWPRFLYPVRL